MTKRDKIIFTVTTSLLTLLILMSVGMYIFNHEIISQTFTNLGYPTYLIYPLATAKIFGLIAIWTNKSNSVKQWAYAGFFFNFVLAAAAHININDGESAFAFFAIVFLLTSYSFDKRDEVKT